MLVGANLTAGQTHWKADAKLLFSSLHPHFYFFLFLSFLSTGLLTNTLTLSYDPSSTVNYLIWNVVV